MTNEQLEFILRTQKMQIKAYEIGFTYLLAEIHGLSQVVMDVAEKSGIDRKQLAADLDRRILHARNRASEFPIPWPELPESPDESTGQS